MNNKETLEAFLEYMKEKPRTYGFDAIAVYDRFHANRLLLQEYIDRFDSSRQFEPLTSSVTITPGSQWEKMVDHILDKPLLSFENSSIKHSRADLAMRISGGKQLTLNRESGDKVKKIIRLKEADPLDGPTLHLRISLDGHEGSVSKAGAVSFDLSKADSFYLSFADTEEENLIGGARYKKIFDQWPAEKKVFLLNELPQNPNDFLLPAKFTVRTHAAPLGRVRASDQYGDGEILLFITMKGSDNTEAGIPVDDASMHYLLPDAKEPYTMNLLLSNKFFISRLVTRVLEKKATHLKTAFYGGEEGSFFTGFEVKSGDLFLPAEPLESDTINKISFAGNQLAFPIGGSEGEYWGGCRVIARDGLLDFELSGMQPTTIKVEVGNRAFSTLLKYHWVIKVLYRFKVETSGENIGKLTLVKEVQDEDWLQFRTTPEFDEWLGSLAGEFQAHCGNYIKKLVYSNLDAFVSTAEEIDAFRLNGLLFRGGKDSAQPSSVHLPGDLVLPGYLAPSRTQFEINPIQPVVQAAGEMQFSTTLGADASVTWAVDNLPGETDEDAGSINKATGLYTAPPSASVVRGNKRVIVTATSGASVSKALLSITPRSIAMSPMVMQAMPGGKYKLSAATIDGTPVKFSLPEGAFGLLMEDPNPDPTAQQSQLYYLPECKCTCTCPGGTEHEFAGEREDYKDEQGKDKWRWVCKDKAVGPGCDCVPKPFPGFEAPKPSDLPRKSEAWLRHRATEAWQPNDDLAQVLATEKILVSWPSGGTSEEIPVLLPLVDETHWFTHHVEGNGVRLKFWGNDRDGDYEVAPEDMTWHLVHGNGTFKDGVYTPVATDGKPLSRYAVVAAIEEDRKYWLWTYAILPIPFITPETLIEKLTEKEEDAAPTGSVEQ